MMVEKDKNLVISRLIALKNKLPIERQYAPIITATGSSSNVMITIDNMINEIIDETIIGQKYVRDVTDKLKKSGLMW